MKPICSICQSGLLDDELDEYGEASVAIRVSPCGHVYHRHCVNSLHDYHDQNNRNRERLSCPICRTPIVTAEGELQFESIFLSAEDESASQRRPGAASRAALSTRTKTILSLAKELKDQSRDARTLRTTVAEQDNLRKSSREGVFQQLADWTEKLKARLDAIEEAEAVELLADNLQEWQSLSAAIIEACEQTRRLPELIEEYKNRVASLKAKVRDRETEMANQVREHRRDKVDSAARFRQKEVDLAKEFEDRETKIKNDLEREVQIWRTKYQTAQESGSNAVRELHLQKAQTDALSEQLDAAKNEENQTKGRLQRLQHKLGKKADECEQAQRQNEEYEKEIARLQAENRASERRIREISEHQSARRPRRLDNSDYQSRFQDPFLEEESLDAYPGEDSYLDENEESLAVDPPIFETPSRRRRNVHPTLRVFRPADLRQREKERGDSNVIAFASDEEDGRTEYPDNRTKTVHGHARNPFAASSRENNGDSTATHHTVKEHRQHGLAAKSRLLQPPKTSVIVLDPSSDPPEAESDEVELVSVPPRSRAATSDGRHASKKPRLAGGKRHEVIPEMFRKPTVDQKAAAVLGNRTSGPKYGRRAV